MSKEYIYIVKDPGAEAFFMPPGFEANVEIHTWGAGGADGSGAAGAGGGYAKSTVTINSGDFVEIIVGSQGQAGSGPTGGAGGSAGAGINGFNGGSGANQGDPEDADAGGAGGGGAATAVLVNGTPVAVGAGGGGGGGYGEDGAGGATAGDPGGSSTHGYNTDTNGQNGRQCGAGGGGGAGGGYPYGGAIGTVYGDDSPGGEGGGGGQNYGNITVAGSGAVSGGHGTTYAPTSPLYGNAGYPGYAVLVLQRKFNVNVKNASNTWKKVNSAFVKVPAYSYTLYTTVPPATLTYNAGTHSFTVPIGVTSLTVTMIAGGGGGSGGADYGSGGGGSGGYYVNYTYPVTPRQVIDMSVGGSGQNTTFGILTCTAGGNAVWPYAGGSAGSPNGNAGQAGAQNVGGQNAGGTGASSPYGTGGAGGIGGGPSRTGAAGATATGYGAGGGGGGNNKGGGGGSPGFVTISYSSLPIASIATSGGWKAVNQIWTKVSGVWKSVLSTNSIKSLAETTTVYTSLLTDTFVVPAGCTKIYASLTGGGGGGGGGDGGSSGFPGASGSVIKGVYSVTPGDVITIGVGGGGGRGGTLTNGGAGAGGSSSLSFGGGRGGNAISSGAGGGGGAASVLKINGTIIAVAAGGGGGGGCARFSIGILSAGYSNSSAFYGTAGSDAGSDTAGGGGGAGGFFGGTGGAIVGGDNGAYSGSDGANLIPTAWVSGKAGNEGSAASAGGNGSITISYYTP